MSVSIPIGADASGIVNAFEAVREAIRRSGQEAKAFKDLDLSHPELSSFAGDLAKVRQQMEDLLRVGRGGTASGARQMDRIGRLHPFKTEEEQDADWARVFPDKAERDRVRGRTNSYVNQGTMFAPPPGSVLPFPGGPGGGPGGGTAPPPPPPPEPLRAGPAPTPRESIGLLSQEAEGRGGGSLLGGMAGRVRDGAAFFLGMAGAGSIKSMVARGVGGAMEENDSNDKLMRQYQGTAVDFDGLREAVRKASEGMGITYQEAQRLGLTFEKLGNHAGSAEHIADDIRLAAGMGRSYGIDAGAMAGTLARGTSEGLGPRAFARLIADATAQGSGKAEDTSQAILRYMESTNRVLVSGGNATGFAAMYAAMNATGLPGFTGQHAEQRIGQIDNAIRHGGGAGLASEALSYRAFSAHGVKDPYQMLYLREGGMFQDIGDSKHTTLYHAQREQIDKLYKNRPRLERLNAYSRHFGISMHDAEKLDISDAEMGRADRVATEAGINTAHMDPTAYADLAKIASANDTALGQLRQKFLGRDDVTDPGERAAIQGASGEGLRQQLARSAVTHGMERTQATRTQDANADMNNGLVKLGDKLIEPLNLIKEGVSGILRAADVMARFFTTSPAPGTGALPIFPTGAEGEGGQAGPRVIPAGYFPSGGGGGGRGFGGGGGGYGGGGYGGGGGGGGEAALPEGEVASRAQQAYDHFRAKGWTSEQAAALAANFVQESGMRTGAIGDGGMSAGIGQWNRERRANFRKLYGHDVAGAPLSEQFDFADWELTHTHRAVADRLHRETTGYGAGGVVSEGYEGPRDRFGEMHRRGALTERMLPGLRQHEGGGGGIPIVGGARVQHVIAPLRVVHEDGHGHEIRSETLPIQALGAPTPYGWEPPPLVDQQRSPAGWYPRQPRPIQRPPGPIRT